MGWGGVDSLFNAVGTWSLTLQLSPIEGGVRSPHPSLRIGEVTCIVKTSFILP